MSEKKQRKNFRDDQEAVWEQLRKELGGEWLTNDGWRQDKLKVKSGEWTITLGYHTHAGYKSSALYTQLRAPFINPGRFRFSVASQGLFESIGKLFGVQDIQIGDAKFDPMFMIQGTDEEYVQWLFGYSEGLRRKMMNEPKMHLQLHHADGYWEEEHPDGEDELSLEIPGKIDDVARLERIFSIFSEVLHLLCNRSEIYEDLSQK